MTGLKEYNKSISHHGVCLPIIFLLVLAPYHCSCSRSHRARAFILRLQELLSWEIAI